MRLEAHNLAVELPKGWEGRIYARRPAVADRRQALQGGGTPHAPATLHAASFALPREDGDFGSTATAGMSSRDAFLAVTEYLEGNGLRAGSGLFRHGRVQCALEAGMFSPHTLLVARPGQAGFQHFFTEAGRPFCLYVVVGSLRSAEGALRELNGVLRSLRIQARP
jgi:hypothetical protein